MKIHRLFKLFLTAAVASVLVVCSSIPDEVEEGLTPMEYFQRAQEASDAGRYELSMEYYEKFQELYPDERERNVWAEYEIALLYHKMRKNQIALERFNALLARYEAGDPDLPEGPRILAEKVKSRVVEELEAQEARQRPAKEPSGE
jgi:tetratricopeptide (TPR) repeat protein